MTWAQTYNGHAVSFLVPDPVEIDAEDIAIGISRAARFAGQSRHFYSVAQHSVVVAKIVHDLAPGNISARLWALLHDAHEYITNDHITPFQDALCVLIPNYCAAPVKEIQRRLDTAICAAFNFYPSADDRALVKHADLVALSTEREQLLRHRLDWGIELPPPHPIEIVELDMAAAQFVWRSAFDNTLALYREARRPRVQAAE